VQRLQKNPTTPDYLASLLCGVSFVHSSDGSSLPVLPALTDVLLRGYGCTFGTRQRLGVEFAAEFEGLASFWSQSANHLFKNFDNPTQLLAVFLGERRDRVCQRFHAALAAFLEDPGSLGRSFEAHAPPVFGLSPAD